MNCERCQELISELLDGSISHADQVLLDSHLSECSTCAEVHHDLESLLGFCRAQREAYEAPANEHAIWLRIRNTIEAENLLRTPAAAASAQPRPWTRWLNRSWQLSFPQLAAAVTAIVVVVSLATTVGLKRLQGNDRAGNELTTTGKAGGYDYYKQKWQQQQRAKSNREG